MESHIYETIVSDLGNIIRSSFALVEQELGTTKESPILQETRSNLQQISKSWAERRCQIAILGLIKSGKSTLLNAWMGKEFLPTSNVPETARIVRVKHQPTNPEGILKECNVIKASGSSAICEYLKNQNADVRQHNAVPAEDELILEAPILSLSLRAIENQSFEILDTPGPNEAGTATLGYPRKAGQVRVDHVP